MAFKDILEITGETRMDIVCGLYCVIIQSDFKNYTATVLESGLIFKKHVLKYLRDTEAWYLQLTLQRGKKKKIIKYI